MDRRSRSLRGAFEEAENLRKAVESSFSSASSEAQENLRSAINAYEECLMIVANVKLFSPNETLDDVSSGDLQYLTLDYHLAELLTRSNGTGAERKSILLRAREAYERYLKLLDLYDALSKSDAKIYEKYQESPDTFSVTSSTDAAARRDLKVERFKEEKQLKQKLEVDPYRSTKSNMC